MKRKLKSIKGHLPELCVNCRSALKGADCLVCGASFRSPSKSIRSALARTRPSKGRLRGSYALPSLADKKRIGPSDRDTSTTWLYSRKK